MHRVASILISVIKLIAIKFLSYMYVHTFCMHMSTLLNTM